MSNIITVQTKNIYGEEKVYPLCEKAELFCGLLKQKTFTPTDIGFIKALGFHVLVEPDYPKEL